MSSEHNLLTDDLLRQIIGVGRVDLLIGVTGIESETEAAATVRGVRACFRTQFPRQRTALLHTHGPGTAPIAPLVHRYWEEEFAGRGGLRTTHLMTTVMPWPELDGAAVRVILAAADLLQARAVVVLDPDAGEVTPERVAVLAAPLRDEVDLLAPAHPRAAGEGMLVTQLLRPLTRAIYGRDLREPLVPEFGASARFATHCTQLDFNVSREQWRTHYWIAAEALAGRFIVRQHAFGARRASPSRPRAGLPAVFHQVVSSVFSSIEANSRAWLTHTPAGAAESVAVGLSEPADPGHHGERMLDAFAADVHNLDEILRRILSPDTHEALRAAATRVPAPHLPDELWAAVVAEFLLAHRHYVMLLDHIVKALLPLYMARAGTFLLEHATSTPDAVEAAVESLCERFERIRPLIVDRWSQPAVR
jgi:hypothetical protein